MDEFFTLTSADLCGAFVCISEPMYWFQSVFWLVVALLIVRFGMAPALRDWGVVLVRLAKGENLTDAGNRREKLLNARRRKP